VCVCMCTFFRVVGYIDWLLLSSDQEKAKVCVCTWVYVCVRVYVYIFSCCGVY
jgi:hypothetical protein